MSAVVDNGKFTATAGVWGWFLGGDGSGVWLGREVLRAVLADLDGLGPATMLTARVATDLGVSPEELTPSALTGAVYGDVPAHGAGRFAHCAASAPGDAVATDLLDRAAIALAASTRAMLTRVEPGAPTVLAGSVACSPAMVQRLRDLLPENLSLAPNGLVGARPAGRRAQSPPWPPPHPHLPCRQPAPGLDATVQRWRRTRGSTAAPRRTGWNWPTGSSARAGRSSSSTASPATASSGSTTGSRPRSPPPATG